MFIIIIFVVFIVVVNSALAHLGLALLRADFWFGLCAFGRRLL